MIKAVKGIILSIAAVLSICLMCSCDKPLLSGIVEPIRMNVDNSKTETTEISCTVTSLATKEYDKNDTNFNYGYGYVGGKFGFGMIPSSSVKHVVEYYITVVDEDGISCRFQIDELDYKSYAEGDTITVQKVQEYSKDGKPYEPYFAYKGEKLKNAEWSKEERKTGEEEQSD